MCDKVKAFVLDNATDLTVSIDLDCPGKFVVFHTGLFMKIKPRGRKQE